MNLNHSFAALRIKEFSHYILGRFIFIMGLRMIGTLVGWWMYELTANPLALGFVGLAEVIPALSLSLYAGHIIDKTNKRTMILVTVFLYGFCALMLLLLSTGFARESLGKTFIIGGIYSIIFCTGAVRAFSGPTFGATIAQIVPKELLPSAITWNSGSWLLASVIGHAAGGFLIAATGNTGTLFTITLLVATAFAVFSRLGSKPPYRALVQKKAWASVKEGLQFVFRTKEILGASALDLFAVLFGGAAALVPIYAKDILKVNAIGFGWLNAASDIGAICIIIIMTIFPLKTRQGKKLMFCVAGFGLCIILFGVSELFWLSFAALLAGGVLDGISVVVRSTILQMNTPDEIRGRVMSVNSMFTNSSNELGQFESGMTAKLMGVVPSVVFGGCMTILVVIITWFKAPSLRKLQY